MGDKTAQVFSPLVQKHTEQNINTMEVNESCGGNLCGKDFSTGRSTSAVNVESLNAAAVLLCNLSRDGLG